MSKNLVRIAAVGLSTTPFDWAGNAARIRAALAEAKARGAELVVLPEMAISGYGCEDAVVGMGVVEHATESLLGLLPDTKGLVATLGLPVRHGGRILNCVAVVADGAILGLVPKQHLARDGVHYEDRVFCAWPAEEVRETTLGEFTVPLGDLVFDVGGVRIGLEICEDAWVVERPARRLASRGAQLILNPSASHFAFGKQDVRRGVVVEGSRAFAVTYLYANLLGNEAGRAIYDGGGIIASAGTPLAETPRFSFAAFEVADAITDIDYTRLQRARSASFSPDVASDDFVRVDFEFPDVPPPRWAPVTLSDYPKPEAFGRVIALAMFDYLRRARARGYVVSLSGGADSAACVCLVRMMVDLGLQQLGPEGFAARVSHLPGLADLAGEGAPEGAAAITRQLLTTAYQATRNSGDVTRNAAREVAAAVGSDHLELDVDALVEGYVGMVGKAVGRELTWEQDDITLQNIQARARAPGVWMLANMRGQILCATSNRSEAAAGYATMDGDTCGGLSPIAGIDKAFLREWLRWLETEGLPGIGPTPALKAVNEQQPTAELRPQEEGQTDEGDLMPYPLLDAIERAAIRDKKMPVETFEKMRVDWPDLPARQLRDWVAKFYRLWCRNQWKRERYAPSFHVDDKNLDPKTWCRFPILSSGFAAELAELEALELD